MKFDTQHTTKIYQENLNWFVYNNDVILKCEGENMNV